MESSQTHTRHCLRFVFAQRRSKTAAKSALLKSMQQEEQEHPEEVEDDVYEESWTEWFGSNKLWIGLGIFGSVSVAGLMIWQSRRNPT